MDTNSLLLTPEEVADELRVHKRTVLEWISSGKLPHVDLGYRTKRIQRSALDAFIRQSGGDHESTSGTA